MTFDPKESMSANSVAGQAEHTLRLIAKLPPPDQLEDRVHRRLAIARTAAERRSIWSLWMPARRLQFAGAALLVAALAGSTWSVYRVHSAAGDASTQPSPPLTQTPQTQKTSGFSTAGAEARPATLTPIRVPAKNAAAPKKKPSASRISKPKTPQVSTAEATPTAP